MFTTIPRTRRAKTTLLVCAASVLAASAIALVAAPAPTYALPAPLSLGPQSDPAAPWLNVTIAALRAEPVRPADPARPVTHTHVQGWFIDTTDRTTPMMLRDTHLWWSPDLAARLCDREIPQSQAEAARHAPPTGSCDVFAPGEYLPRPFTGSPPADPAAMLAAIAEFEPLSNGVYVVARGVASAFVRHRFTAPQTIALLELLRDHVPGLVSRGTVTDRAGRTGTALTVESGTPGHSGHVLDVLVFDQHAQLLSYEMLFLSAPPGTPGLRVPAVVSYELIITAEHVADQRQV